MAAKPLLRQTRQQQRRAGLKHADRRAPTFWGD